MSLSILVEGYHGTTANGAQNILSGGYKPSVNPYDWLGHGVYFFQDGAKRAADFARRYSSPQEEIVVLKSEIRLFQHQCLDFLDTTWNDVIREVYSIFVAKAGQNPDLKQDEWRRELDCTVINLACETVLPDLGIDVDAVRAPFDEGDPIFPNSKIYTLSHVQIAVRNLDVIESTEPVDVPTGP
jgi:hypothetical protein